MTEAERYSRQVLCWGQERQRALEGATVLVAGVGGLGATVSQLLARAGVGRLILVDDGVAAWPDLNRQTLYGEKDVGKKKVQVARERLAAINSAIEIVILDTRIDSDFTVPPGVDAVADCLDNFAGRFALHRATPAGVPFVHGGVQGDQGQVLTLVPGESQPLDLLFAGCRQPEGPIPVSPDGPLIIAGLMANELFHLLQGEPRLRDRMLVVDLATLSLQFLDV